MDEIINHLSVDDFAKKIEDLPPETAEVVWCKLTDGSYAVLSRFPLNVDRKSAKKFADLSHDVINSIPLNDGDKPIALFNIINFPDKVNIDKFFGSSWKISSLGSLYEAKGLRPYNIAFIADVGFGPTVWSIGRKYFIRSPDALIENIKYSPENQKMLADLVRNQNLKKLFPSSF